MKSKIVGGIILLLVIIVIIAFQFVNVNKPEEITVSGYLGGEKEGLMQDEEVKKILKDKYGITVEYTKAGSIEMIEQDSSDKDYLFPSSQTALELFNQTKSDKLYKSEIVFNSPIVIYTWKPIAEALINNRIVEEKDNSYYIADTSALIKLVTDKKKWSDIGVNDLYGYVTIQSTDPNKSNSGNMFAGLVANIMNNETVVDSSTVDTILPNLKVIARALPTDKSRMVKLAQELNLVCGMTGDGVNDAPALKRADVGFAMGSGTDVAKEAGAIVILDDNFKSIENAILYGRTIYNNILKFIKFQLTINVGAVAVCAIAPFFGIEEPLKITHILWINLVMDGLGALALGSEPALKKYMLEKPKSRTQSIVSAKMMNQILFAGAWVAVLSFAFLKAPFFINMFANTEEHMTAYFSMFVLCAVFNGFNVRSNTINIFEHIKENMSFLKVMGVIVIVQAALTLVGGELFSCTPITVKNWLVIIAMAFTIIPVDMIRKVIFNSLDKEKDLKNLAKSA